MGTTTNLALRYPAATDAPDGPGAFFNLAKDIDDRSKWADAVGGGIIYAGTAGTFVDWASGTGLERTSVVRSGRNVTLNLAVRRAAGAFTTANTDTILGYASSEFYPVHQCATVVGVYNTGGTGWGGYAIVEFDTGGVLHLKYISGTGDVLAGAFPYFIN